MITPLRFADHASLRLDQVIVCLRDWGLAAVRALALGEAVPRLAQQQIDLLEPLFRTPSLSARRLRRATARLSGAVRHVEPERLREPLALLIADALRPRRSWVQRLFEARRLAGAPAVWLPAETWAWLGHMAWTGPDFRQQMSVLVLRARREESLFTPGALPVPAIDQRTLWLLLAHGHPADRLRFRDRFRSRRRRADRVARGLRWAARRVTLGAGGWPQPDDLWLLRRAGIEPQPAADPASTNPPSTNLPSNGAPDRAA